MLYDWPLWARPDQLAPAGDWDGWLVLAGRGWGKTRTGAEWVRDRVAAGARRIALIGQTAADARMVMVEGDSGLLACYPPDERPEYQPSRRQITWPNGAIGITYSGDSPDQLRGPQHDTVWADEPAKWQYPDDCWTQMELGHRMGEHPQWIATTTPRPIALIRTLLADSRVITTRGISFDNAVNLPPAYLARILARYEGTRIGRQEMYAEMLDDVIGALWSRELIERTRVAHSPEITRVAIGVDPQGTKSDDDDSTQARHETGIVGVGLGVDKDSYVMADRSGNYSPTEWAMAAIELYHELQASWIVAEVNFGGDMVEQTIRTIWPDAPIVIVRASRGKARRAEPVVSLYEQSRVHHIGQHATLEDEMCTWTDDKGSPSPNRIDALVWGLWQLMLRHELSIDEIKGGPRQAVDYAGYRQSRNSTAGVHLPVPKVDF